MDHVPPLPLLRVFLGLRGALHGAAARIVPPELTVFEHVFGIAKTMMIATAVRLGLPERLEAAPKTAAALASETGANADALARLLRALVAIGVFEAREGGAFAHNHASTCLLPGGPMREFAVYYASASNLLAWGDFGRSVDDGGSAFERVHGTDVWSYFGAHEDEGRQFAAAMSSLTAADAPMIANAYPWGSYRHVCDVAGGRGTLLAAILARHEALRGTLVDAEDVLAGARSYLDERGVASRVTLHAGSFFAGEIPRGADVYLLKDILHDWDDARCGVILDGVRAAMEPGRRLVVCEMPVEPGEPPLPGALIDLHMLVICSGGRQRSQAELGALLGAHGFRLERVVRIASPMAIFDAVAV